MQLQGKITDKQTGETLPGANIYISDANGNVLNPPTGAQSDANGMYAFFVPNGSYVTASFVGMKKQVVQPIAQQCIASPCNTIQNFELESGSPLEVVEIQAKKPFPWLIATAVLVTALGLGFFIYDIAKNTKK